MIKNRPLDDFVNTISELRTDHNMTPAGLSVAVLMLAHEINERVGDSAEARMIFNNVLERMCPNWRTLTHK